MTFVHIVLLQVKSSIAEDKANFNQLTTQLAELYELPVVKQLAQSVKWSEPEFPERGQGYNYGLYITFANKEEYTTYANDPGHRELIRTKILPNVDGTFFSPSTAHLQKKVLPLNV